MSDHDDRGTDDRTATPIEGTPTTTAVAAATPSTTGRVALVALLAVLALLAASIGVAVLRPHAPAFCDRVTALPSVTDSVATAGSPAPGFAASADAFERVAQVAPDESTAAAARVLAEHQRRLGAALAGAASSDDVVTAVGAVDGDPLRDAARTLDDAIGAHCD